MGVQNGSKLGTTVTNFTGFAQVLALKDIHKIHYSRFCQQLPLTTMHTLHAQHGVVWPSPQVKLVSRFTKPSIFFTTTLHNRSC